MAWLGRALRSVATMHALKTPLLPLLGALLASLSGCATEDPGITPLRDELYFPVGLALDYWRNPSRGNLPDPDRPVLIVANSNADLRYNGGTVEVLDMSLLPHSLADIAGRVASGSLDCSPDRLDLSRWECPETQFIYRDATVRIGDFPNEIRFSASLRGSPPRVFAPIRGQNHLLWLEVVSLDDGSMDLRCNNDAQQGCDPADTSADCAQWDCDGAHEVRASPFDETQLPTEPFGIALSPLAAVHVDAAGRRRTCTDGRADPPPCGCGAAPLCPSNDPAAKSCCSEAPPADQVYVAHLADGQVSLFLSDAAGVQLRNVRPTMFDVGGTAVGGAFGLAPSVPGDPLSPTYLTSRFDGDLASFIVRENQTIVQTENVTVTAVNPPLGLSSDFRGIALGRDPARLYVASRAPSSVAALRITDEQGVRRYDTLWVTPVCNEPSVLVLGPNPERADPLSQLIYLVCFGESKVLVIDADLGEPVGEIQTGRGPNTLLLGVGSQRPCVDDSTCTDLQEVCRGAVCQSQNPRALVANFLENTIGVIDLDPANSSYHNMVLRIGLARKMVDD